MYFEATYTGIDVVDAPVSNATSIPRKLLPSIPIALIGINITSQ